MAVERGRVAPAADSAMLILHGQARIQRAANGAMHTLERKDAGLLAYLALEGPMQRGRLAALLWPDVDEDKARTNLRQRLSRLRKTCGDIVTDEHGVLALASRVVTDSVRPAAASLSDCAELLGTHGYDDCPEFFEWLERQRAAERTSVRTALVAEANRVRHADPDRALEIAHTLLKREPESEEAYRLNIELYYLRGDIASAQSAYEKCREILWRVYSVVPSAATEALARRLQSNEPAQAEKSAAHIPVTLLRPPRLIGRTRSLATARRALAERHTLVIAGEAGIGKSRLIEELLAEASMHTLHFRARPSDTVQTWGALARLCQRLYKEFRPTGFSALTSRELARLIPDVGPAPEPISSQAELLQLHEAIAALIAITHEVTGGLLIAFDDLQFADVASVDALRTLIQPEAAGRGDTALFIIATRAEGGSWQAKDLVASLDKSSNADAVILDALRPNDTRALLRDLDLGDARWIRMAEPLHRHCGGNPAFLLESIKAMIGEAPTERTEAGFPIPPSVQAALAGRLARLGETARAVTDLAAVAGGAFSIELAASVLLLPRIALAPALREVEAAQVMSGDAFVHDLVEDAVLRSISEARRERLHLQVAHFLQSSGAAAGLIAHHLLAAGDKASALPHLRAAACQAESSQRPDEAARLLEEVARIELASGHRAAGVAALANCFSMYMATSFVDDANRIFEEWSALVETEAERLQLHAQRASQQSGFKYLDEALRHAQAALAIVDEHRERLDAALLADTLIGVAPGLADSGRAVQALALARSIAPRLSFDNVKTEVAYRRGLALALNAAGRHIEAISEVRRAVQLHEAGADLLTEWDTRAKLARYLSCCGRHVEAAAEAQRAIDVGRRQPHFPTATSNAHYMRGIALAAVGEYREALHYLVSRRDYFVRTGWRFSDDIGCRLALIYLQLGRPDLARAALPKTLDASRMLPANIPLFIFAHALLARATGSPTRPHLKPILDGNFQFESEEPLLQARLLAAGESAPADALMEADAVLVQARELEFSPLVRAAAIAASHAALTLGARSRAIELVNRALDHAQFCSAEIDYQPSVWLAAFNVFTKVGDTAAAHRWMRKGVEWVERVAREYVADEFSDSFRSRNPVNRALLKAAAEEHSDLPRSG